MANHVSHAALPYPIKNARFTISIPFLDADGDPTDPTTPDTEISQDGGAFADAAEEVTTIGGSNGLGYITLSGAEMNNSVVGVAAKVASGPKATLMEVRPRVLATVGSGTLSAGSAGGGTLGTLLAYDVTGCFIRTTGGTGGGGTGGANNQARRIITYNTSTGAFTVAPNWETTPDNTTTYDVLLPEGVTLGMLRTLNPATAGRTLVVDSAGLADANCVKVGPTGSGTTQTARDLGASVLLSVGIGTGQVNVSGGKVPATIAAGDIANDAITANAIAADAIGASELAADAVAEIADGVWDELRLGHTGLGTFGQGVASVQGNVTGSVASVTGNVGGNVTGSVGSVVGAVGSVAGAVGSVTGNVDGNVTGSVGSVAAGGITASSIATGAIDADALAADAGTELATAILDLTDGVETSYTLRKALRLILSAAAAKLSGAATTSITIRDVNDSKNRIVASVDASGNRTAVTLDAT